MEFKPLTFTLYFTFPKFVPRNQLQIGHKNDDKDCRKEGITINILQATYMIPKRKYTIELSMLLMSMFDCQIVFGQNFAPILKKKYKIVFFVKKFTI